MKTYEFGLLQSAAYRELISRTNEFLSGYNITANQWAVLGLAHDKDSIRLTDVADLLHIRPASASEHIQDLVEQKLIERKENEEDRRVKDIILTESGRRFVEKTEPRLKKKMQPLLAEASSEDITGHINTLKSITKNE